MNGIANVWQINERFSIIHDTFESVNRIKAIGLQR
jgi:hypothetical protein